MTTATRSDQPGLTMDPDPDVAFPEGSDRAARAEAVLETTFGPDGVRSMVEDGLDDLALADGRPTVAIDVLVREGTAPTTLAVRRPMGDARTAGTPLLVDDPRFPPEATDAARAMADVGMVRLRPGSAYEVCVQPLQEAVADALSRTAEEHVVPDGPSPGP